MEYQLQVIPDSAYLLPFVGPNDGFKLKKASFGLIRCFLEISEWSK